MQEYKQIGTLIKRASGERVALVLKSNEVLKNNAEKLKKLAFKMVVQNFANFNFKVVKVTPLKQSI